MASHEPQFDGFGYMKIWLFVISRKYSITKKVGE